MAAFAFVSDGAGLSARHIFYSPSQTAGLSSAFLSRGQETQPRPLPVNDPVIHRMRQIIIIGGSATLNPFMPS